MIVPLVLAAAIDGGAALQHASRLAALGPHPWGSALGRGAALYVASQLKDAGLRDVRLDEFEQKGIRGANVVGVRPGTTSEIVVVGAHHDTAPDAPGAYDDGGGVGILIEVARAMAGAGAGKREIVFVSFDGEEGWSRGAVRAGSRAWVEALGPRARQVTAAVIVEMSGWKQGTPTVHALAYADPLRPGMPVIAPGWLVREALRGARATVPETALGDPYLSWAYQPAVRAVRVQLYGDDVSFLERGVPSVMVSDSSFSRFYPWYHTDKDTADKLDEAALGRVGNAVLGMVRALESAPAAAVVETQWWSAFGYTIERTALLGAGIVSLLPLLWAARKAGGPRLVVRLAQAAGFGALLWRQPVIAVWSFGLANLAAPLGARLLARVAALLPLLAFLVLCGAAWMRGAVTGLWLASWELALFVFVALVALTPLARTSSGGASRKPGRASGGGGGGRRKGLPKRK
jgi:hypothetical protein